MRAAEGVLGGQRGGRGGCSRRGGSNISYLSLSLLTHRCQGCSAGGGQSAPLTVLIGGVSGGREGGKKRVFAHSCFALDRGSQLPKEARSGSLLPTSPSLCWLPDFRLPNTFGWNLQLEKTGGTWLEDSAGVASPSSTVSANAGTLGA